ncbi:MAG: bifunctional demethylmenaquinone methyltransferase/2-methoxy-6-polyprenyl-1,4-benzoquinol methylase UbiE [Saprospirales bacterium]|nr:MAG: bifunctional demethylmenaquinone methyltransferase/2-methoxy-6-polyprenyl-1,4-benzoquinol methylase UbiE [Saprospirales bacterium]
MAHIKPYEEEGSKKEQVARMFDNIAWKYDFLNRFLSLGIDKRWRKKAIRRLNSHQPEYILDVATGTGDVAIEIARQFPNAEIKGVDISQKMLDIGNKKLEKRGLLDKIELVFGDSENLSFSDHTFDAVTVAFGVRNFENLEKGLKEIYRVLKPGGRVVILEFSRPRMFPLKQIFNTYFKYILPTIGRLTSRDPKAYKYLYESVQVFPDYDRFTSVLMKCGYTNSEYKILTTGICCIYEGEKS